MGSPVRLSAEDSLSAEYRQRFPLQTASLMVLHELPSSILRVASAPEPEPSPIMRHHGE